MNKSMILSVFATLSLAGQSAVLEVGAARQYKTIQAAADVAVAGDTVLIDAGVYREWVKPANAGTSDRPITYRARERGKVVISGADVIVGWRKRTDGLWEVKLPYDRFGGLNPFTDFIHGNWFEARNKETYPRAFLFRGRGKMRYRAKIEDFKLPYYNSSKMKYADGMIPAAEKRPYVGSFALKPGMAAGTVIADFKEDPNDGGTELVVRPCCFYPVVEFRDYQRLEGLVFCDAGPNWAGPHSEQLGVVGVNWSRGWVIEDCEIRGSTCAGLTLGKHGDEFDNYVQKSQRYTEAIDRAIKFGFDRVGHHTVRRCRIRDCGQAGVCGSLGAVFSTIADCDIGYCHWLENFDGCEMACIKLHGAVDVEIVGNELHHAGDFGGIWLDWMSQGTFVSRNRIHDLVLSRGDAGGVYIEVGHGPSILENNVIDARQAIHICGTHDVAIVGNELCGSVSWWDDPFKRSTPFWKPHSPVLDQMLVRCTAGGCRLYNNVMKLPVSCPLDARSVSVGNLVVSNRAAFAAAKRSAAFVPVDTATLGTNTLGQAFERRDGSPYVWRQAAEKTAAVSTTHNERNLQ